MVPSRRKREQKLAKHKKGWQNSKKKGRKERLANCEPKEKGEETAFGRGRKGVKSIAKEREVCPFFI